MPLLHKGTEAESDTKMCAIDDGNSGGAARFKMCAIDDVSKSEEGPGGTL